jgi:hypothetical protein
VSDWTRIADRAGVAEISGVLDLATGSGEDLGVLPRVVVILTLAACLGLAGCRGDEPAQPAEPAPSSIQAFPDPPHVDGPLTVGLRAALPVMRGERSSHGAGYRVLGESRSAVVDEVSAAQSDDHTSWGWTARFAAESRGAVRRAKDEAAALGGVVLVIVGDNVAAILAPTDLTPRRATRLGLQKAEAWGVIDGFVKAETR